MRSIDLFCGMGGMRLGADMAGAECVFSSEIDPYAALTYKENFGELPSGDITKIYERVIPKHDIIFGGFPCQSFSIAGRRGGFQDTRGTLFFDIARIASAHRPEYMVLENVKGLLSHDSGRTMETILSVLRNMGYNVAYQVVDTKKHSGIPQNRERVYFVCSLSKSQQSLEKCFPRLKPTKQLKGFLEESVAEKYYYRAGSIFEGMSVLTEYSIAQWRRRSARIAKVGLCPTLTAHMGTGGNNVPIVRVADGIRKLTPRECARLQGFPDTFRFPEGMSDSRLYKQIGNSVTVPIVKAITEKVMSL